MNTKYRMELVPNVIKILLVLKEIYEKVFSPVAHGRIPGMGAGRGGGGVCVCVCCSQGALNRMEAIEPETFLHQCFEVTKVASTKFPPRITVLAWHRQPIHRIKEMTTAR